MTERIALRICETAPDYDDRLPGDMWRYPPGDLPGTECWWIVLPRHPDLGTPGHPGQISWRTTQTASGGVRWRVTGTPPRITVDPSIDVVRFVFNAEGQRVRDGSYWHGWIRDGYLEPA